MSRTAASERRRHTWISGRRGLRWPNVAAATSASGLQLSRCSARPRTPRQSQADGGDHIPVSARVPRHQHATRHRRPGFASSCSSLDHSRLAREETLRHAVALALPCKRLCASPVHQGGRASSNKEAPPRGKCSPAEVRVKALMALTSWARDDLASIAAAPLTLYSTWATYGRNARASTVPS